MATRKFGNATDSASSLGNIDVGGLSNLRNMDINPTLLRNLDIDPPKACVIM